MPHSTERDSPGSNLGRAVWPYANHVLLSIRNESESRRGQGEECTVDHMVRELAEEVISRTLVH